jgi:transcriptional regulator with XRE-family HTH domain
MPTDDEGAHDNAVDSEPKLAANVLGAHIRAQRQLADLSLRQLAEMTKVSNAYLSQIERGLHQPSLRILRSIAEALDITDEELMERIGLRKPATGREPPAPGTEAAIQADPHLAQDEKDMLLGLYRNFRQRHEGS